MIPRYLLEKQDCFLSLKKNAHLSISTIINYRNDSMENTWEASYLSSKGYQRRGAYSPADLYPPLLEEERDRECKLSTKWRSIPLIKLHNTPVHGTTPLSLRRNKIYIRIDSRNVRSRPINERVTNLSVVRAFLHVYTREGMKVEKRRG